MKPKVTAALVLGALLFVTAPGRAAANGINSDQIQLIAPAGVAGGVPLQSIPEGSESGGNGESVTIACPVCIPGAYLGLTQPGSTIVSDILAVSNPDFDDVNYIGLVQLTLTFISDPFLATGVGPIDETGGLQDVSRYLLSPTAISQGWSLMVQSDLDAQVVPEPASLLLFGSGLAGMIGRAAWRKRRS